MFLRTGAGSAVGILFSNFSGSEETKKTFAFGSSTTRQLPWPANCRRCYSGSSGDVDHPFISAGSCANPWL